MSPSGYLDCDFDWCFFFFRHIGAEEGIVKCGIVDTATRRVCVNSTLAHVPHAEKVNCNSITFRVS